MNAKIEAYGFQDYKEFGQNNTFSQDLGVVVCPIASFDSGFRLIRLHGGYGLRKASWVASRDGKPPIYPAAGNTADDILLGTTISPALPTPNDNGTYNWSVSGSYLYVQRLMRTPGQHAFPVGEYPFRVEPAASRAAAMGSTIVTNAVTSPGAQAAGVLNTIAAQLTSTSGTSINGETYWPFLILAPIFSSDHLIGG